jgi:hypothetical protein
VLQNRIFYVLLKVWFQNNYKRFFGSAVDGADVDGSVCDFFVYVVSDFVCSWWGGAFLYSDWAELL